MTPIDRERLDVAHAAAERLLHRLRTPKPLKGRAFRRMRHVETAVRHLELARLA